MRSAMRMGDCRRGDASEARGGEVHALRPTDQRGRRAKCVAACCASARFYGDLDDPNSDASKALAAAGADSVHRLKDVGNGPQTAYILSAKYAEWKEEVK